MSQDKSPNTESSAEQTAKAVEPPVTDESNDASDRNGNGKRKQSAIAQPVDALRQPAGKVEAAKNEAAKTESTNSSAADVGEAGKDKVSDKAADKATDKATDRTTDRATDKATLKNQATPTNKPSGSTSTMSSSKQTNVSKSRGVWGGIFLGLVLVAVALAAGLWWQQQRFEAVAKEIATRLQQSDQQLSQASDRASQALALANAQREVVDQLSRELSVTNNELTVLQQAWEAANEGLDQTLLLNDLKRLIGMANQELTLFGNVNSAVSILSSVQSMLKAQPAAPLKNLQQAVTTDLARLRAVPQVDMASLSARLDSLIQLTGKAPLLSPGGQLAAPQSAQGEEQGKGQFTEQSTQQPTQQPTQEAAPQSSEPAGDQPWWETVTGKVTTSLSQWTSEASAVFVREFADVMSIRKADDPQALLLSEEQAIQLRANVRAMLLSAQLALMTRQTEIWRSELTEVQSLLNTRYDKQALDTKAAINLLSELLKAPVAADVPQINDTLGALASAERALSIPAESVSGEGGDTTANTDGSSGGGNEGSGQGSPENSVDSSADSTDAAAATGDVSGTATDTATEGQAPATQPSRQGN